MALRHPPAALLKACSQEEFLGPWAEAPASPAPAERRDAAKPLQTATEKSQPTATSRQAAVAVKSVFAFSLPAAGPAALLQKPGLKRRRQRQKEELAVRPLSVALPSSMMRESRSVSVPERRRVSSPIFRSVPVVMLDTGFPMSPGQASLADSDEEPALPPRRKQDLIIIDIEKEPPARVQEQRLRSHPLRRLLALEEFQVDAGDNADGSDSESARIAGVADSIAKDSQRGHDYGSHSTRRPDADDRDDDAVGEDRDDDDDDDADDVAVVGDEDRYYPLPQKHGCYRCSGNFILDSSSSTSAARLAGENGGQIERRLSSPPAAAPTMSPTAAAESALYNHRMDSGTSQALEQISSGSISSPTGSPDPKYRVTTSRLRGKELLGTEPLPLFPVPEGFGKLELPKAPPVQFGRFEPTAIRRQHRPAHVVHSGVNTVRPASRAQVDPGFRLSPARPTTATAALSRARLPLAEHAARAAAVAAAALGGGQSRPKSAAAVRAGLLPDRMDNALSPSFLVGDELLRVSGYPENAKPERPKTAYRKQTSLSVWDAASTNSSMSLARSLIRMSTSPTDPRSAKFAVVAQQLKPAS